MILENSGFDIKERIFSAIKHSDGLSISDVARILHLNYITASKYLAVLEAEKRITFRHVGMAKLYKVVSLDSSARKEATQVRFVPEENKEGPA